MSGDVLMESYRAVKSRVAGDVCWARQRLSGNSAEASGRPQTAQRARKRRRLEGAEKGEASAPCPPYGVRRNVTSSLAISYSNFLQV